MALNPLHPVKFGEGLPVYPEENRVDLDGCLNGKALVGDDRVHDLE